MFKASSFEKQNVLRGADWWTHGRPAASHLMTEGMWDQKVSTATAVNIYRNPNAQAHSQTLVVS